MAINQGVLDSDIRNFLVYKKKATPGVLVQSNTTAKVAVFGSYGTVYMGEFAWRDGAKPVGRGQWLAIVSKQSRPGAYGLRLLVGGKVYLAQG